MDINFLFLAFAIFFLIFIVIDSNRFSKSNKTLMIHIIPKFDTKYFFNTLLVLILVYFFYNNQILSLIDPRYYIFIIFYFAIAIFVLFKTYKREELSERFLSIILGLLSISLIFFNLYAIVSIQISEISIFTLFSIIFILQTIACTVFFISYIFLHKKQLRKTLKRLLPYYLTFVDSKHKSLKDITFFLFLTIIIFVLQFFLNVPWAINAIQTIGIVETISNVFSKKRF